MQVWEDVSEVPSDWPASVVTIGAFDGVHKGHRQLIRTAVNRAKVAGLPSLVLTFSPNPAEVVGHGEPPVRISTLQQRLRLISELGPDATAVIKFSEEVAALTPSQFAGSMLSDRLHAALVVIGENFRFGHKARGDVTLLRQLGGPLGFTVEAVHLLRSVSAGQPISSTLIRKYVAEGDVSAASRALVRPHRVEGVVVAGDGRGHELGFPTANVQHTPRAAIPADGIYAGRMVIDPYGPDRESLPAAISIGTNPTFDGVQRRVESFAYDADNLSLYDKHIAVDFVARIRDQERFPDSAALVTAVERDIDHSRAILGG